jgi:hypothetical protein
MSGTMTKLNQKLAATPKKYRPIILASPDVGHFSLAVPPPMKMTTSSSKHRTSQPLSLLISIVNGLSPLVSKALQTFDRYIETTHKHRKCNGRCQMGAIFILGMATMLKKAGRDTYSVPLKTLKKRQEQA